MEVPWRAIEKAKEREGCWASWWHRVTWPGWCWVHMEDPKFKSPVDLCTPMPMTLAAGRASRGLWHGTPLKAFIFLSFTCLLKK